jgi:hypothetical protein
MSTYIHSTNRYEWALLTCFTCLLAAHVTHTHMNLIQDPPKSTDAVSPALFVHLCVSVWSSWRPFTGAPVSPGRNRKCILPLIGKVAAGLGLFRPSYEQEVTEEVGRVER